MPYTASENEDVTPRFALMRDWPVTQVPERKRWPKKDPRVASAEAKLKTLRRRELPPAEVPPAAPSSTWVQGALRYGRRLLRDLVRAVLIAIGKHYILVMLGIGGTGAAGLWQVWEWFHPKPPVTEGWGAKVYKEPVAKP